MARALKLKSVETVETVETVAVVEAVAIPADGSEVVEESKVLPKMIGTDGDLFRTVLAALGITFEAFEVAYLAAPRTRDRAPSAKAIEKARALIAKAERVAAKAA